MSKKYRVYTNEPTNWGDRKVLIKIFSDQKKANTYFNKLIRMTSKDVKETDDVLYVIMEDVTTDRVIKSKYFNR